MKHPRQNERFSNIEASVDIQNKEGILCEKCGVPLELQSVKITYLKSTFPTRILRCPSCGLSFVSEELAMGKMVEVEELLEEK